MRYDERALPHAARNHLNRIRKHLDESSPHLVDVFYPRGPLAAGERALISNTDLAPLTLSYDEWFPILPNQSGVPQPPTPYAADITSIDPGGNHLWSSNGGHLCALVALGTRERVKRGGKRACASGRFRRPLGSFRRFMVRLNHNEACVGVCEAGYQPWCNMYFV